MEIGVQAAGLVSRFVGAGKYGESRRLSLLSAGVASGVSAGFGASIAGAFFAVETVLQPNSDAVRDKQYFSVKKECLHIVGYFFC